MSEDSRRRSLLDSVKSELASIPKYRSDSTGTRSGAAIVAGANAFTAIRRGVRLMRGAESSAALDKKRKRLEYILDNEKKIKGMAFEAGSDDGLVDYNGRPVRDVGQRTVTSMTVGQALSRMYKDADKQ